jgi:HEAT repeat protein
MDHAPRFRARRPMFPVLWFALACLALDARPGEAFQAATEAVTDGLRSPNPSVRRKAAADLGKSRRKDALSRLAELVRDPDAEVRMTVLRGIASLRESRASPRWSCS